MPRTQGTGLQVQDGTIQRIDLDAVTPGAAVIRRLLPGTNVTFTSTGPDSGTGDVTVNASTGTATPIDWVGGTSGALPTTPPANITRESSFAFAGFVRPYLKQSDGQGYTVQPNVTEKSIYIWTSTNTATPIAIGINIGTNTGTPTARAITPGGAYLAVRKRFGIVSAATAASLAGNRQTTGTFYASNVADQGGFLSIVRFGISASSADARMFVGCVANTAAPTNVEPNTINNSIGVGKIAGSANLQLIVRNAAAATTTDLGVNFPANTANATYELGIYVPPNSVSYSLYLRRLDVLQYVEFLGMTVNVPVVNTLLNWNHWICNNATAAVVSLDILSQYAEAP